MLQAVSSTAPDQTLTLISIVITVDGGASQQHSMIFGSKTFTLLTHSVTHLTVSVKWISPVFLSVPGGTSCVYYITKPKGGHFRAALGERA